MAEILLVTEDDLLRHSIMDGNMDRDKYVQYIKIAQETHIQEYLGTDLLNKIKADIASSSLVDPYASLLEEYIKPMLIHWALVEIIPFISYTIANKGAFKYYSENAEPLDTKEVSMLVEKQRNIAQHYTRRFIDYICHYPSRFPEYYTNSNEDVHPLKKSNFGGWEL